METTTILNHTELINKILQLREQKAQEDAALKTTFKEFVNSLDPITLAKKSLRNLALDQQVQYDLVKVGLNLGTNFVIGQVMRKYPNMKGFLSSVVFQQAANSIIQNNVPKLISGITHLMHPNSEEESNE